MTATVCAVCRHREVPDNRSVCETCLPSVPQPAATRAELAEIERDRATADLKSARVAVAWWQGVAEAKQDERDRYRAALEFLSQVRHVSGSAQPHMRSQLRTIDAVLAGADVRNIETVEAIAAGTWRRESPASEPHEAIPTPPQAVPGHGA